MILSLIGAFGISTEAISQLNCCTYTYMDTDPDCCESPHVPGNALYELRGSKCCVVNEPREATNGLILTGAISDECCQSLTTAAGGQSGTYKLSSDNQACCLDGSPRRWNQKVGEGGDSHCCKDAGGDWSGYSCCKKGEPVDIEQNIVTQGCCRKEVGKWTSFANKGYCCQSGTGMTWDGKAEEACCRAIVGDGFTWKNGVCCSSTGENLSGGSNDQCCTGPMYNKTYDATTNKYKTDCCPAPGVKYKKYSGNSGNWGSDTEFCCKSGGPMYIASYASDVSIFIHKCCKAEEKVYNTGVTVNHGGSVSLQSCCKGSVYNKLGSDHQDCCEEGTVYKKEQYEGCCPKDKFVVEKDSLEACCRNQDDVPYKKNVQSEAGETSKVTSCCELKKWSGSSCCKSESSALNEDGKPDAGCCSNAGGSWVGGSSDGGSSSSPDSADGQSGTGSCCKGSTDLVTGSRTEDCCKDAGGMWMGTFCCYTWGRTENGACVADGIPEGDKGYADDSESAAGADSKLN